MAINKGYKGEGIPIEEGWRPGGQTDTTDAQLILRKIDFNYTRTIFGVPETILVQQKSIFR